MNYKKIIFIIILTLIFVNSCSALENSMKLLAVKETSDGFVGSSAELTLEIVNGKGRVFVETSPLTKIDTQLSTRMAKEISCNFLNLDCSNLDFIYKIKSDASIVGGPSAGAAMAILTVTTLTGIQMDKEVSITGTINSGELIGQVGGVKEKILSAKKIGLNKVLIPMGEISFDKNNETINFTQLGIENDIIVKEVTTLNAALFEITGKSFKNFSNENVTIDKEYSEIMANVADGLCERTEKLTYSLKNINLTEKYEKKIDESRTLFNNKKFYSAASNCFSANIKLTNLLTENLTIFQINELNKTINSYEKEINEYKIKNIPEFQTFIIVKKRINEANKFLEESKKLLNDNKTDESIYKFSFSKERFNSAKLWSSFFEKKGKKITFKNNKLRISCNTKISEANERMQYVNYLLNNFPTNANNYLGIAKKYEKEKEYALCLNYASLSKANSDVIINSAGINNDELFKKLIKIKLKIAKENIIKEQKKGRFPILAYSYYEYSENLIDKDVYSSLLFSQYALELSDFSQYLNKDNKEKLQLKSNAIKEKKDYELLFIYLMGIISGLFIGHIVYVLKEI